MSLILKKHDCVLQVFLLLISLWLCFFIGSVHAASLQVAPILLEFSKQQTAKELWLTNTGQKEIYVQTQVNQWTQKNHNNQLQATNTLIASPMVSMIKPGQKQLVRLIRAKDTSISEEQAFRIIVEELPQTSVEEQSGLKLLLRYSIPVFINTSADPLPEALLDGVDVQYHDHKLMISNKNQSYRKFSQLSYLAPNGSRTIIYPGLLGYVLAEQVMQWEIPEGIAVVSGGKFMATINGELEEQNIYSVP